MNRFGRIPEAHWLIIPGLSAIAKSLYMALAVFVNREGRCNPSHARLLAQAGIGRRSLQRARDELQNKCGLVWRRKGPRATEYYWPAFILDGTRQTPQEGKEGSEQTPIKGTGQAPDRGLTRPLLRGPARPVTIYEQMSSNRCLEQRGAQAPSSTPDPPVFEKWDEPEDVTRRVKAACRDRSAETNTFQVARKARA